MSYRAANLPAERHCFFGREGGVSEGKYASLNVRKMCGDIAARVDENRKIAVETVGGKIENLMVLAQQSGKDVYFAEEASIGKIAADGVVTKTPGMALALFTADCTPVLLADYEHGVIAAAHAGWRGAVRGVLENTLDLMLKKGAVPECIAAALGPCIQQSSFEVGAEVKEECAAVNAQYVRFFAPGKDDVHFQFDLEGLVKFRLEQYSIKNITVSGIDTYREEKHYFSYRRNCHQGLAENPKDFPCQASIIRL